MGDVSCILCEKVLAQNKFLFKCKTCKVEFQDVPALLAHFMDSSLRTLSCETLEPIVNVKIKKENEAETVEDPTTESSAKDVPTEIKGSVVDDDFDDGQDEDFEPPEDDLSWQEQCNKLTIQGVKQFLEQMYYEAEQSSTDTMDSTDFEGPSASKKKKMNRSKKLKTSELDEELHDLDGSSTSEPKLCLVCGFESFTESGIRNHILKHHGKEEFERWSVYDWSLHDPETHVFQLPKPTSTKKEGTVQSYFLREFIFIMLHICHSSQKLQMLSLW